MVNMDKNRTYSSGEISGLVKLKGDFINGCIKGTEEFIYKERDGSKGQPFHIHGRVYARSAVPHQTHKTTDTDYDMYINLYSDHDGIVFNGHMQLPNDDKETEDGPAYACRRIKEYLKKLTIMSTLFRLEEIELYEFDILDKK